jgi:hypothetical protein
VNARTRRERAMLRERRRWGAGLTEADLRAAFRTDRGRLYLAAARLELLFRHNALGDGMAYVSSTDPRLPRAGEHTEILGPTGSGKTFWGPGAFMPPVEGGGTLHAVPTGLPPTPRPAFPFALPPINGAYWMGDDGQEDDDPHTYDHMCPDCGPCRRDDAAAQAWGDPEAYACDCCGCEEALRIRREEDGTGM